MICAACHVTRAASDLLAFWPLGRPGERRFVCRPTCPSPEARMPCFGAVVRTADVHAIALDVAPRAVTLLSPVRPGTLAWNSLLDQAGVRRAA